MTTSTAWRLGDVVPAFTLPDTEGVEHTVPAPEAPPATVLVVTCNHCPYVIAWNPRLRAVAEDYAPRGVRFLTINANDAERYPADSPEHMRRFVREQDWPIPYLFDESQDVARAYSAACTPDAFLFDPLLRLVYRGQLDESRPGRGTSDGRDIRAALDAVLAGRAPSTDQRPSIGCSIKWR
jgi:peroxiredoxin